MFTGWLYIGYVSDAIHTGVLSKAFHSAWAICAMRCWGSCSEAVGVAEEHFDRALGRHFRFERS